MLEMIIDSIRINLMNRQRVVILRVKGTNQYLAIRIGPDEAEAIAVKLQDVSVPRPLTHDLLGAVIDSLGASVDRIVVSDLNNDTFFAKIRLTHNGSTLEVDARPSDAIALAVRTRAPIFAADAVIKKASVEIDEETRKRIIPNGDGAEARPLREEDLRSLSAFTDFVETLNLEDLENPA